MSKEEKSKLLRCPSKVHFRFAVAAFAFQSRSLFRRDGCLSIAVRRLSFRADLSSYSLSSCYPSTMPSSPLSLTPSFPPSSQQGSLIHDCANRSRDALSARGMNETRPEFVDAGQPIYLFNLGPLTSYGEFSRDSKVAASERATN